VDETADEINAAHYSQGKVAAGFTSTVMEPITRQKAAIPDADVVQYARVKKNGYVRIVTNHGAINLELFCQQTPKACENFITHCKNKYYDDTKFYRIVRNFMMQGGDPTNLGTGGESIWGKSFKNEIIHSFSHSTRGVLSMANRGPDTNGSQFFITFRPCKYLDGQHTIFGRVVGGLDVLTSIERVPVDKTTDKPLEPVTFLTAEVFVDPFEEAEEQIRKEREVIQKKKEEEAGSSRPGTSSTTISEHSKPQSFGIGVGKYIKPEVAKVNKKREGDPFASSSDLTSKAKRPLKSTLTDFSSW